MPLVAVALCFLAFAGATALCLGLSELGRRLAHLAQADRLSRKDRRWLAGQDAHGETA